MRKKRILSMLLSACMAATLTVPAMAANVNTAGGTGNTPVQLTAEATTFDVTVPTSIPIKVNADGTVTCPAANAVKITNNSAGPVKVTQVEFQNGTWSLVNYNGGDRSTLAAEKVDSKKLGIQMSANSGVIATSKDGGETITQGLNAWKMGGANTATKEMEITCAAIATAVSSAISQQETAASVIFTLAWDV